MMTLRTVLMLVVFACSTDQLTYAQARWTPERAAAWQKEKGWLIGSNFIPSSAINQLEMWQADTFDEATIDRELGWAKGRIAALRRHGRPLLCTEYLARSFGSTIQSALPVLKANNVGAYIWGLVDGKTQTIYPWSSWTKPFTAEPPVWHHDLFRANGTPFDKEEIRLIRSLTGKKAGPASKAPPK